MPHHNETIANLSQLFSSQVYKRFVEMGRVCLVQYGPEAGKLGVVIDIMNSDRVLLDGVHHNGAYISSRQVVKLSWVALTDITVEINRAPKQTELAAAASGVLATWNASAWAKKIANRAARANMTDFDRYKLQTAKSARGKLFRAELAKLKK